MRFARPSSAVAFSTNEQDPRGDDDVYDGGGGEAFFQDRVGGKQLTAAVKQTVVYNYCKVQKAETK